MTLPAISVVVSLHVAANGLHTAKATTEILLVDEAGDSYEKVAELPVITAELFELPSDTDRSLARRTFLYVMNQIIDAMSDDPETVPPGGNLPENFDWLQR